MLVECFRASPNSITMSGTTPVEQTTLTANSTFAGVHGASHSLTRIVLSTTWRLSH